MEAKALMKRIIQQRDIIIPPKRPVHPFPDL